MKKVVIVALIMVAVFVTFGFFSGLLLHREGGYLFRENFWDAREETTETINQIATVNADDLDRIVLKTISSKVVIYTIEGDDIVVELSGISYSRNEAIKLETEVRGDVAYIEVKYPRINTYNDFWDFLRDFNLRDMSSNRFEQGNLRVGIPVSYMEQLTIDTVSGSIVDEGNTHLVDKIKINTVSGNANVDDFICEDIDLDTISGNFTIYMDSISGSSNSVSGDLNISGEEFIDEFDFDSVSGNADFRVEKELNLEIDFDSVSGDFNCDYAVKIQERDFNSLKATIGDGDGRLDADTTSGDVTIS